MQRRPLCKKLGHVSLPLSVHLLPNEVIPFLSRFISRIPSHTFYSPVPWHTLAVSPLLDPGPCTRDIALLHMLDLPLPLRMDPLLPLPPFALTLQYEWLCPISPLSIIPRKPFKRTYREVAASWKCFIPAQVQPSSLTLKSSSTLAMDAVPARVSIIAQGHKYFRRLEKFAAIRAAKIVCMLAKLPQLAVTLAAHCVVWENVGGTTPNRAIDISSKALCVAYSNAFSPAVWPTPDIGYLSKEDIDEDESGFTQDMRKTRPGTTRDRQEVGGSSSNSSNCGGRAV